MFVILIHPIVNPFSCFILIMLKELKWIIIEESAAPKNIHMFMSSIPVISPFLRRTPFEATVAESTIQRKRKTGGFRLWWSHILWLYYENRPFHTTRNHCHPKFQVTTGEFCHAWPYVVWCFEPSNHLYMTEYRLRYWIKEPWSVTVSAHHWFSQVQLYPLNSNTFYVEHINHSFGTALSQFWIWFHSIPAGLPLPILCHRIKSTVPTQTHLLLIHEINQGMNLQLTMKDK